MDKNKTQEPTSIKELLQGMMPESMEVLRGTVISANPLQIKAVNDDKLVLSGNNLCVPWHLSTYKTTIDIAGGVIDSITDAEPGHEHKLKTFNISGASMTVYNGLKQGDAVYLLSFNHGKKYYVLDRD